MADAPNRLAGTAYMTVDGKSVALVGEFSYRLASPVRESMLGQDGYHGYKETPAAGQIKAKLRDGANVSVSNLANGVDETIQVVLASGKVIVGRSMVVTEQPVVSTDDASIDLTWEGPSVTEVAGG